MEYTHLLLNMSDHIVTLTINRPKAMNALNRELMQELDHFFTHEAPAIEKLRGIILTGAGDRAFVAGADISEFLGLDEAEGRELSRFGQEVFFKIERFPKPVIAVVNGFALGGGCELAMACHLRIAESNARFGQPEVNLGLIPGYGGTQRLVNCIGKTRAIAMLLTGDAVGATDAMEWGLVNAVTEKGEGVERAVSLIEKISAKGPLAVAYTLDAVHAGLAKGVDGYRAEHEWFGKVIASEDGQEGCTAFLEKRKADFKGK